MLNKNHHQQFATTKINRNNSNNVKDEQKRKAANMLAINKSFKFVHDL